MNRSRKKEKLFFNEHAFSNSSRSRQDPIGLNIGLYNEMDVHIRETFRNEITICEESVTRATYFHGYLLEQTLQVFDIRPLELSSVQAFTAINQEAREAILRRILLTPKVLILKDNFYTQEGTIYRITNDLSSNQLGIFLQEIIK